MLLLFLIICVGLPLIILTHPSTKGWAGEKLAAFHLKRYFPKGTVIFNDLYFHNGKRSCQIDHLIVSQYGIFVIETKNYLGLVYGDASEQYLRRKVLLKNYRTYNPARQNERHLEYLKDNFPIIADRASSLHSIVVFAAFTRLRLSHNPGNICTLSGLKNVIDHMSSRSFFSEDECKSIVDEIQQENRRKR